MSENDTPVPLDQDAVMQETGIDEKRRAMLKSFAIYALVAPPLIASILNANAKNALAANGSGSAS